MLSDRVGAVGLAAGLTMMIISRKRSRLRIVKLENLGCTRRQGPLAPGHGNHPRPADILDDMDSRASDKIPGARVRVKRHRPAQPSSRARPREWLALADGAVQEARTEGAVLALVGDPLPYQPGRAERRSGVPAEVITSDHVPNSCTCSWAYSQGKLTLKYYNAACPVHLTILGN
jgi:hypothetical protein